MSIQLTDKLYAATGSKVLADAIQVAGGYMAITSGERGTLTDAQKVIGTIVFETDTNKTFRYDGSEWVELIVDTPENLDNRYVVKTGNSSIVGNLSINGDLMVTGESIETHLENINTPQNTITLRDGATTPLITGEYTGIVAKKYDGVNDGFLAFDSTGTAYVGDSGSLQPLATRTLVNNNRIVKWDAENNTLVESPISVNDDNSLMFNKNCTLTADGHTLIIDKLDGTATNSNNDGDGNNIVSTYATKTEAVKLLDEILICCGTSTTVLF